MKTVTKIIGFIVLIGILLVLGTCYWQNCRGTDTGPQPPSIEKAGYSLTIKNTGVTIYTTKIFASENDTVYFLPDGYWEANQNKFIFKRVPLTLDERVFGEIITKRR